MTKGSTRIRTGLSLATAGLTALSLLTLLQPPATSAAPAPARPMAASAAGAPGDDALVARLREEADGAVRVSEESATGEVGFVRVARGGDLFPASTDPAVVKADAFLAEYSTAFGAAESQLVRTAVSRNEHGTTVSYAQEYRGLRVFGAELRVNLDPEGDLTAVNGYAAPGLTVATTPALAESEAVAIAVAAVRGDPLSAGGLSAAERRAVEALSTELVVYRQGSTKGETGPAALVYLVEVGNGTDVRELVFVDARTGKLVNRYATVHDALQRRLYEGGMDTAPVWQEGDAFPGALDEAQQELVTFTGEAYWLFRNAFGRDSWDGSGGVMHAVRLRPESCEVPNAFWNSAGAHFCPGTISDDIVAHEWGHAYTEATHDLIYQWQPGALNESYSDIWGETLDLVNGRDDEDEGDLTTPRPVGGCTLHTRPDPVVVINSPASIAKVCDAGPAEFGPRLDGTGVTADVVHARTAAGSTLACEPVVTDLTGRIALVDRGICSFTAKVKNAQDAGAVAVLVSSGVDSDPGVMTGSDPSIFIPSVQIKLADRNLILRQISFGDSVNVTVRDALGDRVGSHRWLVGEKATAFGGAIRDMWTPTCYGDPGKVSDIQYECRASVDNGGVHINSGVPNHGYTLLVDGGTYNGVTVPGIGLDKAAHIYYRAMTAYQTPTSDFVDHADALQASCTDLVDQPITTLTVEAEATPAPAAPVTTEDCAAVTAATAAVELRSEPVRCGFQPLLDPNAPAVCGPATKRVVVWRDDFEAGLDRWTPEQEVVFPGGTGLPWRATSAAPGGHPGGVAYAPDPDAGDCLDPAGSLAGRDSLVSPVIELPTTNGRSARLTFEHYLATELGYDGGNVKIKVDGAPTWSVVPASAYLFNPPRQQLHPPGSNTSPLAGQIAFSGTDGGSVEGSWGESQIDLSRVGALPGSTIQLRLDFGRDSCAGRDGWYVDNVTVSICKSRVALTAAHVPDPSVFGESSRVDVTVQRDGTVGLPPTGLVVLRDADGAVVGKDSVVDGAASVLVPATFPAGTSQLQVHYKGDGTTFADESVPVTVVVEPAPTQTLGRGRPSPAAQSETIVATATVTASGAVPTGDVEILTGGEVVGRGALFGGTARISLNRTFPLGVRAFLTRYLGSRNTEPSSDYFWVRVVPG